MSADVMSSVASPTSLSSSPSTPVECALKEKKRSTCWTTEHVHGYRREDTVIVFDWDDTLFPTTSLLGDLLFTSPAAIHGYHIASGEVKLQICKLECIVHRLLEAACKHGHVHIITNSASEWVKESTAKFYPSITTMLDSKQVCVSYARPEHEKRFPDAPEQWKFHTFRSRLVGHFAGRLVASSAKNLISIGDSEAERFAAKQVANEMSNVVYKSVRMIPQPTLEELIQQLESIANALPWLCHHTEYLDMQTTIVAHHNPLSTTPPLAVPSSTSSEVPAPPSEPLS